MALNIPEYLRFFGFKRIKRRGENFMASCPDFRGIHSRGDRRPSFGIQANPPHLSHCFTCDTRLNFEQLTAKLLTRAAGEPINEYEAWLWLEEKGWLPKEISVEGIQEMLRNLEQPEGLNTPLGEGVLDKFERGVHPSIIYGRGITIDAAKEWELRYDKVTRRTIIPVRNRLGLLVGILSRAVDEDAYIKHAIGVPQPGHTGKYSFQKRLVLYGEHKLRKKPKILVVETPLDVIYGWGYGVQEGMDIVALMGTKASPIHLEILLGYKDIILALDNDDAGREGTKSLIRSLQGKVRLWTFNHFGAKDLGDVEPDDLLKIEDNLEPVILKEFKGLKLKHN